MEHIFDNYYNQFIFLVVEGLLFIVWDNRSDIQAVFGLPFDFQNR